MKDFKSVARTIGYHGKVMWKGFITMVYGAATAALVALAIYGFVMIATEEGWVAVCDFVGAAATSIVALISMYSQGAAMKKGAKR